MDYISSMFPPLHQSDELLFPISNVSTQQDFILVDPPLDGSGTNNNLDKSRRRKLSATTSDTSNDANAKKILHRDIERQRRQEMATLYASLRSLLPLEYIKRSISDHMNEAANYIRNLKKKVQELNDRRDNLKRSLSFSKSSSAAEVAGGSSRSSPPQCVIVQPCWAGVEVIISGGLMDGVVPLSRVLRVPVAEGFSIVTCASAKVNERTIHTIQLEVCNLATIDLPGLQQKLMGMIQLSCSHN